MAATAEQKTSIISFKNVSKVYPNGVQGLKDLNIEIEKGEFVIVVGLSGAGKSTMLRAINRLHEITSGDIEIDGQSITRAKGKNLRLIRRDIGMIFQSFNLVKRSSVLRNVLTGRVAYHSTLSTMFGLFPKEDKQLAYEALQRVNLAEKVYTRADELSGGQQQRVSIARALTQEPKIILADEPVASLDPLTTEKVMDDLSRINQELGITIVVNLHSVELARQYGSRIIGLRDGQVVFDGSVAEATDETLRGIYGEKILEANEEAVI
ncbi:phosphonate ABC transporter ATP-binding protein [Carnobacterium maltaromaticum]|uniref:phosphonate ABC transporter ATP-binding protein n=1 Tax=Carnobacterium maltaromaticum TaxID=2751 RepID=UPI00295EC5E0|nr:phosphonate ABC transporter ATP-binding protein [Carnobacterium maltaromaticum]